MNNPKDLTTNQLQEWLAANPEPQTPGGIKFVRRLKRKLRLSQEEEQE